MLAMVENHGAPESQYPWVGKKRGLEFWFLGHISFLPCLCHGNWKAKLLIERVWVSRIGESWISNLKEGRAFFYLR